MKHLEFILKSLGSNEHDWGIGSARAISRQGEGRPAPSETGIKSSHQAAGTPGLPRIMGPGDCGAGLRASRHN